MVNHVTADYLDACANSPWQLPSALQSAILPPTYANSYKGLMFPRPIFIGNGEVTSFATDLQALFQLLTSLPARFFDDDLGYYSTALGIDNRLASVIKRGATKTPELYARADAYHNGNSFQLLEFNVGSELGGVDAAQMNRAFLQVPEFREFALNRQLQYVDTAKVLADRLLGLARKVTSDPDPVVALIDGVGGFADHEHVFTALQEAMHSYGVRLLLGETDQIATDSRGKLLLHKTPVDIVLRYFTAGEILNDPHGHESLDAIMHAHEEGHTLLYTPLEGALYASKGALGLLHDPQLRKNFTAGELDLIDRIVPWTRIIGRQPDGFAPPDQESLLEYCRDQRQSLLLKPGIGYGATGVVVGALTDDHEWAECLRQLKGRDYVVQQIVAPASEPVYDRAMQNFQDWRANWGVFVTETGYSGAFVRALKSVDGSIISYANSGTRGACVFSYPDSA